MTIKEALKLGNYSLEAEVLLVYSLKHENIKTFPPKADQPMAEKQATKEFLYSNPDFDLKPSVWKKFKKLIEKRATGVPIAYLTHSKEFFGLDFYVDENVLIPRPETEMLVEEALDQIKNKKSKIKNILDVGTGSGNIIISLTKTIFSCHSAFNAESIDSCFRRNDIRGRNDKIIFYATDISQKALEVARKNAKKHKVKINFIKSDLFRNLTGIKFDLIIANLPYLWEKFPQFEPLIALDGGRDGLKIIEKFLQGVGSYLSPKGIVLIEIDPRQVKRIKELSKKYLPHKKIAIKKDLAGLDRVVILS